MAIILSGCTCSGGFSGFYSSRSCSARTNLPVGSEEVRSVDVTRQRPDRPFRMGASVGLAASGSRSRSLCPGFVRQINISTMRLHHEQHEQARENLVTCRPGYYRYSGPTNRVARFRAGAGHLTSRRGVTVREAVEVTSPANAVAGMRLETGFQAAARKASVLVITRVLSPDTPQKS